MHGMDMKGLPPAHGLKVSNPAEVLLQQMANKRGWSLAGGSRSLKQAPGRYLMSFPCLSVSCLLWATFLCHTLSLRCSAASVQAHSNGACLLWTGWRQNESSLFEHFLWSICPSDKRCYYRELLLASGEYISLYILNRWLFYLKCIRLYPVFYIVLYDSTDIYVTRWRLSDIVIFNGCKVYSGYTVVAHFSLELKVLMS